MLMTMRPFIFLLCALCISAVSSPAQEPGRPEKPPSSNKTPVVQAPAPQRPAWQPAITEQEVLAAYGAALMREDAARRRIAELEGMVDTLSGALRACRNPPSPPVMLPPPTAARP